MHFVGVDLAWGDRKPTGLAVLDDDGQLVHVSAAGTDEEIVAALAPYVEGDCLVAIDAPLIVTNATGNRPAEAALNKDFARFDAGAHPSNTGKPEFREQPRGARIAARLGLDMNPRSGAVAPGDRGLPAPGDGGAVPARPHAEVQEQARPRPRAAPRRAARADRAARGPGRRPTRRSAPGRPAARCRPGRRCGQRSRRRPARASCGSSRTRSTRWCAPTSRCSRRASPSAPRRTATSRPATSSPRPCPRTSTPSPRGPRIAPAVKDPGGSAVREYAAQHPALRRRPSSSSRW